MIITYLHKAVCPQQCPKHSDNYSHTIHKGIESQFRVVSYIVTRHVTSNIAFSYKNHGPLRIKIIKNIMLYQIKYFKSVFNKMLIAKYLLRPLVNK